MFSEKRIRSLQRTSAQWKSFSPRCRWEAGDRLRRISGAAPEISFRLVGHYSSERGQGAEDRRTTGPRRAKSKGPSAKRVEAKANAERPTPNTEHRTQGQRRAREGRERKNWIRRMRVYRAVRESGDRVCARFQSIQGSRHVIR